MKFRVQAVDDWGNPGTLTLRRGKNNVIEYWSFTQDAKPEGNETDRRKGPVREEGQDPGKES